MSGSDVSQAPEAVAIVGMAGRFPGARGLEEFWRNLADGVESIRFYTDEELAAAGIAPQVLSDPAYVKARAELADIELFDAGLFGFTPREAEIADPQQRIFLECVWEALEDAGYDPARYPGDIALYGGASMNTYLINNLLGNRRLIEAMGLLQTAIFNRNDHLTTHTAYTLNLKGPSVTVQTTCSTSLVAVHMACQALTGYHCDMALAGGVAVPVPNRTGYFYQEGGIGSPDGHCRAFDAQADGTVSGSGAGVVVLKRLSEALADGDCIRAVIRSSAINNDGAEKIGYTAPSVAGQAQAIAMAQAIAGISPERISYIECHGTGTSLGDPIEIEALTQVFRRSTARKGFCAIGSVKTNLGHLDTAAGIAGLIKTTLALQHRQLPANLHFREPNPRIDFADSPFRVNAALSDWPSDGRPRMAGVSSFGIGGTNAHLIVEEAPPGEPRPSSPGPELLTFSARSKSALNVMVANLADHLHRHPQQDLGDVAYTLQVGRRALGHRCAFVCRDREDALSVLAMSDVSRMASGTKEAVTRPVAFMFPGQGAQYVNAAVELYRSEATFQREIDRCAQLLRPHLDCPLQELLFAPSERVADAGERLQRTAFAQPALFAVEYALARLFMEWGVQPQAMIGHSVGEYVAACLSGVFSLEDALKLVAARGRLMQSLPGGSMLSVSLSEAELRARLGRGLEIAAINSPSLCVVAGRDEAVAAFEAELIEQGVGCLRLRTSHAFHSSMMEPILDEFLQVFDSVELRPPGSPYISTLTGAWITHAEATSPAYWAKHLRHPVQFGKGLGVLFEDPAWILLEVGPGRMLMSMARRHPQKAAAQMVLHSLPPPDTDRSSAEVALLTLGQLWAAGVEPDWHALHRRAPRGRVPLPAYPFERQRYWIDARGEASAAGDPLAKHPDLSKWLYAPSWKRAAQRGLAAAAAAEGATWLFFADRFGVASRLAESLRPFARSVVSVSAAQGFAKHGALDYALDPGDPAGYLRLFEELERDGLLPQRIVHAYGIELPDPERAAAPASFYSLLYLAQALGTEANGRSIHIDIVVANANEVTGAESVYPEQATLAGPCLVIPQEYAGVSCRMIDLDFVEVAGQQDANLPEGLLEDLREPGTEGIAYRNGYRWVRFFEQIATQTPSAPPFRLRRDGVYLITGGLGGMGLTVAHYLASQLPGVQLALVGRSPLPQREHGDERRAAQGEGERADAMIAALSALEAQGAQAIYFSVDVSDPARLREVVAQVNARFGPITGLVHTAGIPGNGLIQLKTAQSADRVLAAKLQGTRALYDALSGQPLDFSILCSSRSALLGGLGSVDYSAANAYLDAFAQSRRKRTGEFVVSVNWPAWQEVGMLADNAAAHRVRRETPSGPEERVGHPLVDRHIAQGRDRHLFRSRFAVKSHWVLDEHRILGTAVVPGVTYLEMARAAFAKAVQAGPVEIGDVYFLTPLRVQDDEAREVRLVLERAGEGYDFHVESAPAADATDWVRHVIGKIAACPAAPARRIDIAGLIAECGRDELRLTEENFFDESLGPRWQCANHVHRGDGRLLAELRLADEYSGDLEHFQLHPALLDRAAGIGLLFLVERSSSYLPFGYGKLRLYAPLRQRVYIASKGGADPTTDGETTAFDVDILAEDGTLLAQIHKFAHKRINEVGKAVNALMAGHRGGDEPARASAQVARGNAGADDSSPFERVLSLGISPAEGAQVFARMLARTVPAQVVVSPSDLAAVIEWARQATPERYGAEAGSLIAPATHARPGLETAFVAPASELERRLATLWQECLGIDRIGLHDDFFELGGNSVLAIQIMANARKAGLNFNVQQLFQYSTLAELAAFVEGADARDAEAQGAGALPLLPAQRRFLEADARGLEPAAWSVLLEIDPVVDPASLQPRLEHLLASHDALRLHFPADVPPGTPSIAATPAEGALQVVDLRDIAPADRAASIATIAARTRAQLRIGQDPLAKIVLFRAHQGEASTLLFAAHPLAADPGSARVLIQALRSAIDPAVPPGQGASAQAPRYRRAVSSALEFAGSPLARHELGYWEALYERGAAGWPSAYANGTGASAQRALHSVSLGHEETRLLVAEAPRAYRARIEEVVLAGLAKVLGDRIGDRRLWIDCHARLDALPGEHLRDVVGPFATVAPVAFELPAGDNPGALLTAVKEQWRAAPRGGAGYDLLRSPRGEADPSAAAPSLPDPSIGFAYLGAFDDTPACASAVRVHPSLSPAGLERPERAGYAISVRAFVHAQRLHLHWSFDPARIDHDSVVALASDHGNEIDALARHCAAAESDVVTPSDFPLVGLDSNKLRKIFDMLEKADESALH